MTSAPHALDEAEVRTLGVLSAAGYLPTPRLNSYAPLEGTCRLEELERDAKLRA